MINISVIPENKKKENWKTITITLIIVVVSSAIMSISTVMFLNPLGLYAGGVTGISQIILHFLGVAVKGPSGWNAYDNYLGYLNFILLLPFNVLAWFKLSKKYAIYTTISSVVQTVFLAFSDAFVSLRVFMNADNTYNVLPCVITAAILAGISNGYLMGRGATSGGIITLCQYLNLKKGRSVGAINLFISAIITLCGATLSYLVAPTGLESSLRISAAIQTAAYTFICFLLENLIIDYVHTSYNKVKLDIVTEKGEDISRELIKDFPHGITISRGIGAYSNRPKEILTVIIQNYESNYYFAIIKEIDPAAFVSVIPCSRIFGRFIQRPIDK